MSRALVWRAGFSFLSIVILLLFMIWLLVLPETAHGQASLRLQKISIPLDLTATAVAGATSEQELEKLRLGNNWFWSNASALISTAISAVVAGIVAIFGLIKWFGDRSAERERRREEQDRWLDYRVAEREKRKEEQDRWLVDQKVEREKRSEERFQLVIERLCGENPAAKVGAAIMLRTFLGPDYERFYGQVFDLAV